MTAEGVGAPIDIEWDDDLAGQWAKWLTPTEHKSHFNYQLESSNLRAHTQICFDSAMAAMTRVAAMVPADRSTHRILDHGCSAGFKALALRHLFPAATVEGFDPEEPAVSLAAAIASRTTLPGRGPTPSFRVGVGESLPYPDNHFDLISSVTVIEHVQDVGACIREMARVLRPGGLLYLEAPNYQWPLEPHLGVVMPPRCPKSLLRGLARVQGAGALVRHVDDLQLVYPKGVEAELRRAGLRFENLVAEKLRDAMEHGSDAVIHYSRAARVAAVARRIGLGGALATAVLATGLYPSLMYAAWKPEHSEDT